MHTQLVTHGDDLLRQTEHIIGRTACQQIQQSRYSWQRLHPLQSACGVLCIPVIRAMHPRPIHQSQNSRHDACALMRLRPTRPSLPIRQTHRAIGHNEQLTRQWHIRSCHPRHHLIPKDMGKRARQDMQAMRRVEGMRR